jgi:hypothetical protein
LALVQVIVLVPELDWIAEFLKWCLVRTQTHIGAHVDQLIVNYAAQTWKHVEYCLEQIMS